MHKHLKIPQNHGETNKQTLSSTWNFLTKYVLLWISNASLRIPQQRKRKEKKMEKYEKQNEKQKMPQSGVGSMQGKNNGNMPSAMCASSMDKSLDPSPI